MVDLSLILDFSLPVGLSDDEIEALYSDRHLPLLLGLMKWKTAGTAVVINSGLAQRWIDRGLEEGLDRLRELFDFGRSEILGTASHHAILPLVPENVAFRQVRRNLRWTQQILHPEWRPAGFAPPELAYGHELARVLLPLGFHWCLADDTAYAALHGEVPKNRLVRCGGLTWLLASRLWSQRVSGLGAGQAEALARSHHQELQGWIGEHDGYQVLRVAAHKVEAEPLLGYLRAMETAGNRWCHPSHLLHKYALNEGEVPPGSARTPVEDFWNGAFFSPWRQHSGEPAWQLSQRAILALERVQDQLDELLTSSTFESTSAPRLERLQRLVEWCEQGFGGAGG